GIIAIELKIFLAAADLRTKHAIALQSPQLLRQIGRIGCQSIRQVPQMMAGGRIREVVNEQPPTGFRSKVQPMGGLYLLCGNGRPQRMRTPKVNFGEIGLVELVGIEPTTSSLRTMRSPS